jgi:hypothetical protein
MDSMIRKYPIVVARHHVYHSVNRGPHLRKISRASQTGRLNVQIFAQTRQFIFPLFDRVLSDSFHKPTQQVILPATGFRCNVYCVVRNVLRHLLAP